MLYELITDWPVEVVIAGGVMPCLLLVSGLVVKDHNPFLADFRGDDNSCLSYEDISQERPVLIDVFALVE